MKGCQEVLVAPFHEASSVCQTFLSSSFFCSENVIKIADQSSRGRVASTGYQCDAVKLDQRSTDYASHIPPMTQQNACSCAPLSFFSLSFLSIINRVRKLIIMNWPPSPGLFVMIASPSAASRWGVRHLVQKITQRQSPPSEISLQKKREARLLFSSCCFVCCWITPIYNPHRYYSPT